MYVYNYLKKSKKLFYANKEIETPGLHEIIKKYITDAL